MNSKTKIISNLVPLFIIPVNNTGYENIKYFGILSLKEQYNKTINKKIFVMKFSKVENIEGSNLNSRSDI